MGNNKGNNKKESTLKHALVVALGTFFIAILISSYSQIFLERVSSMIFAFALLFAIILVGIIFDIVGTAATAATEAPFHARASRKLPGAKNSIWIVRNADKVANFCNDVVGDICGTVSGSVGAIIAVSLVPLFQGIEDLIVGTVMIGLVSSVTVGGKAFGKNMAVSKADKIILIVGQVMSWFQKKPKGSNQTAVKRGKGSTK
ncbi:MAG: hypothetical protein ACOX2Q_06940 [Dehalobacterium sp.]